MVKDPALQAGDREFDSHLSHKYDSICKSNRLKLTVMVEFEETFQVRVLQP